MQTEERRKILIVDDDPMVLKVIRSYLKDRYKVYCIRSGEEEGWGSEDDVRAHFHSKRK